MTTKTLRARAEQLKQTECVDRAAWLALIADLLAALPTGAMANARILRAAEILRETATGLRESVTHPPEYEWSDQLDDDEKATKPGCDEMLALAGELEEMAR